MNIYCDGGTRGGVICIVHDDKIIVKKRGVKYTNNELEYLALIYAIEYIRTNQLTNVTIYSDSKLIVNQVNGKWRVTTEALTKLHEKATTKLSKCCSVQLCWIRRERNKAGIHLDRIKASLRGHHNY